MPFVQKIKINRRVAMVHMTRAKWSCVQCLYRPIYTIRFVVYDSDYGVCDQIIKHAYQCHVSNFAIHEWAVSSIYIWSENLVAESEAKDGGSWRPVPVAFYCFSCFDVDLKKNTVENAMKTVYDLHRFWTSITAIFGFTFHIGRMTEVLTPDIYIYI